MLKQRVLYATAGEVGGSAAKLLDGWANAFPQGEKEKCVSRLAQM
jgi:hypothetical protein